MTAATQSSPHTSARVLAPLLAAALGPLWRAECSEEYDHSGRVRRDNAAGPGVWFSFTERPGRIVISGLWPRDPLKETHELNPHWLGNYTMREKFPTYRHDITVAATLDPAHIAGQITRRFLPGYLPVWHAAQEYADQRAAYAAKMREVCTDTVRRLGGSFIQPAHDDAVYPRGVRLPMPNGHDARLLLYIDGGHLTWQAEHVSDLPIPDAALFHVISGLRTFTRKEA